jgi:hypothetical protein
VDASRPIYEEFFKKYPRIKRIDPSVSNHAILAAGFSNAFTLYGTVAHEFAYRGLPTFSGGINPHIAFSFTRTPKNKDELRNWIRELPGWEIEKSEILKFVYMHNYCYFKHRIPQFDHIENSADALLRLHSDFVGFREKMRDELEAITRSSDCY